MHRFRGCSCRNHVCVEEIPHSEFRSLEGLAVPRRQIGVVKRCSHQ
jgi:hypothetical protein